MTRLRITARRLTPDDREAVLFVAACASAGAVLGAITAAWWR